MAGRLWREAASLMVVGRAASVNSKIPKQDYKVLFLKRNERSSFMPNSYVFPGGVSEPADFSEEWFDVFKKCGYEPFGLLKDLRTNAPSPMIFSNKTYSITPEIGFRIGAIREAFEECGLLIAHHFPFKSLDKPELTKWQQIVHQDASQFVVMFQELGGCPGLWDLHEWISWLTPTHFASRRFDTAFFITFMEKIPQIFADDKEVVDIKVVSPLEMVKQWRTGAVQLPPPQVYEVSRLLSIDSYEELEEFARERGKNGMDHYFPVRIVAKNGTVLCLAGDDLYPEEPDYTGEQAQLVVQETVEELRGLAQNHHRMELKKHNLKLLDHGVRLARGSITDLPESLTPTSLPVRVPFILPSASPPYPWALSTTTQHFQQPAAARVSCVKPRGAPAA
ncbi:nucleoside diphosphate-linked moiety X motif 19-like isoform X2 [Portunus trituberculatus]|nr:nucleoside diphosphate-linked moiety X motif 19-like isoform X2 [Portunus trituberculatus]